MPRFGRVVRLCRRFVWFAAAVPVAWHEQELSEELALAPSAADRNLGTVHVADAERLFALLAPYWYTDVADDLPSIRTLADHCYALTAADGRSSLMFRFCSIPCRCNLRRWKRATRCTVSSPCRCRMLAG
ncbi:hypothetical protein [Paenibacillus elgii]|uniref:hypothetical protein n=1 Tax=Paenibacillus elgii TaxID=189691 RepID=UPI0030D830FA